MLPLSTAEMMAWKPGPALLCGNSFALSPGSPPFFRSIYMQKKDLCFLRSACSCSFPSERRQSRSPWKEQRLCFHRKSLLTKRERLKCVQQELSSSEMALSTGGRSAMLQRLFLTRYTLPPSAVPSQAPQDLSQPVRDVRLQEGACLAGRCLYPTHSK